MFDLVITALCGDRRRGRKVQEFTRQLSMLLKAGFSESEALWAILCEMPSGRFRAVLEDVQNRVERGGDLSYALQAHPKYFRPSYVSIVTVGEKSGSLPETMDSLVDLERRPTLAADKLWLAIGLPLGLLICFLSIASFLARSVIPAVFPTLGQWPAELGSSAPTSLAFAAWLWCHPQLLPLGAVGFIVAVLFVFEITCHRPARKSLLLSRFAASLRVMVKANLPLEEIQSAVQSLSRSTTYRAAVDRVFGSVQAGSSFTEAFRAVGYFPETFQWLVATGESQDNLEGPLRDLSSIYALRADAKLSTVLNITPPLVTVWLGVAVGVFAYSFFTLLVSIIYYQLL